MLAWVWNQALHLLITCSKICPSGVAGARKLLISSASILHLSIARDPVCRTVCTHFLGFVFRGIILTTTPSVSAAIFSQAAVPFRCSAGVGALMIVSHSPNFSLYAFEFMRRWEDFVYYTKNSHPLFVVFFEDKLHPYSRTQVFCLPCSFVDS